MSKDHKREKPVSKSGGTPGVIWMLGGFVLGVVVTVLYRVGTPPLPKKSVGTVVPPSVGLTGLEIRFSPRPLKLYSPSIPMIGVTFTCAPKLKL